MRVCQVLECLIFTFLTIVDYFPKSYAQLENTVRPEATIPQGTLEGITLTTREKRNISAFLGIPFAQPPIGNLRFAGPVAADGWNGTLYANADSIECPQMRSNIVYGEEDCLYINVYTPKLPQTSNSTLLPVMVYIHGGAFKMGSQASIRFGPGYLLDEDVVLAVANYRLGALGFLSTGDEVASGNWGLKDQVLALEWVQENIRYFGGDPDQVTLFGESAGAALVHLLTLSDATIGLFHRYITQSGTALTTWAYGPKVAYSRLAFQLGKHVGCSNETSSSLISCLRTIDFSNVTATELQLMKWTYSPSVTWVPTDEPDMEGAILTDSPRNLFAAGRIRDLPWISGVVQDEGLLKTAVFYKDEESLRNFLKNFDSLLPNMLDWTYLPDSGTAWVKATKSYYFNDDLTMNSSLLLKNLTTLASDSQFHYPTLYALREQHALMKTPHYFYIFNYGGINTSCTLHGYPGISDGVGHGDELRYLFSMESVLSDGILPLSQTDHEIIDAMVHLWTSFAINGKPTALALNGTITWESYSKEGNHLRIGNGTDTTLEVEYSFFEERMQFWADIDARVEPEETLVYDSGTVTSSPNLLLLLLISCAKFIPGFG